MLLLLSGDPKRRTGGNLYDARMIAAARGAGIDVRVATVASRAMAARASARARPGFLVVDSIALAHAPAAGGARVIALIHMQLHPAMWRRISRSADRVVCVSRALAGSARAAGARHVRVIAPGSDAVTAPAATRHGRTTRVLCVANWSAAKGIDVLLRAAARVDGITLELVGDAPDAGYAQRVHALLADPRLAGRVRVRGPLGPAALARRYASADVAVFPSRSEGYGIALAEAVHNGLPVITSDLPATREVGGGAPVFVPPGRVAPLTAALRSLQGPAARARAATRSRHRAPHLPRWRKAELSFVRLMERELHRASSGGERHMPPRGVKSKKRTRQYEHIKKSELARGRSTKTAKRIAAATTNKTRRKKGETKKKKSS